MTSMMVYGDLYAYRSGIYSHTGGSFVGAHAVVVVGYVDDSSVSGGGYFIVKNSWGTDWGEGFGNDPGGYFRIAYSERDTLISFGYEVIVYNAGPPTCSYNLTPSSTTYPTADYIISGGVLISPSASSCAWTATSDSTWLPLTNTSGEGTTIVGYSVAANTSTTSRTATISVFDPAGSLIGTSRITQPGKASSLPAINSFAVTPLSNSLTIPITAFKASGTNAITGYQITTSSTKPTSGWLSAAPASITVASEGIITLYAWAKDSAGNVSTPVTATAKVDMTKPVVSTFTVGATSTSTTVSISALSATDTNSGVTGYLVTDNATTPLSTTSGWTAAAPATYTVNSSGTTTLYAWARDAAGNVSLAKTATVNVVPNTTPVNGVCGPYDGSILTFKPTTGLCGSGTPSTVSGTGPWTWSCMGSNGGSTANCATRAVDTVKPVVTAFTLAQPTGLTVPVSNLTATDNVGVTGYLVTESALFPAVSAPWQATIPTTFTFVADTTSGVKTVYAWARDAADNISDAKSATVTITSDIPVATTTLLPRTGQTSCYGVAGTLIPCPGIGQDGDTLTGITWPNPRFADNGDQTITDKLTGLVWTKDAYPTAGSKSWQESLEYIKTLNAGNYLGHNDWRFPNRNELVSLTSELILDSNQTNRPDWLGKQGFSNVQPNYWSSTTRPDSTSTAMMISMSDGTTTYSMNKTLDWYCPPAISARMKRTFYFSSGPFAEESQRLSLQ